MHLSFITDPATKMWNFSLEDYRMLSMSSWTLLDILKQWLCAKIQLFLIAQDVMEFACVSVEQAASLPSVSLKPLDGMEGLNISASTSRPKDAAALAALMRLSQGWQKPGATVKGKCILVSRCRLEVDIGYQADVIEIFKNMPSKNYGECNTAVARIITTLVFSAAKNGFKSVISIFCCSVSVGNISLHFQTFILPLIVIIQWDVIWSSSVCLEWHEETEQTETD